MIFTRLASGLWSATNAVVGGVYRVGILRRSRLPVRTISVGNIQAGGSGKTPFVALLAREAIERGHRPVILTRGYGGSWASTGGVIRPGYPIPEAHQCGDEVKLLASLVPEAWIGVGGNRVRAFELVRAAGADPDLAILDDGFQHFRLERDVDIVLMTSLRPGDRLFRESERALRRASLIVWTKGKRAISLSSVPTAEVTLSPAGPMQPARRYWLVSGVGDPDHLERSLKEVGYKVEKHVRFRDHARYSSEYLESIRMSAEREGVKLLTTGKDWVKWAELQFSSADRVEPEVKWVSGREEWERAVWGT